MYYIDAYLKKIVDKKDFYAAPERYIEYRVGVFNNMVKETYIASYNPLTFIDFAYSAYEERDAISAKRSIFFKMNKLSNDLILFAYTVPPKWYVEEIEKFKKEERMYKIKQNG